MGAWTSQKGKMTPEQQAVREYGTKTLAARALGIPRTTLNSRLESAELVPAVKGRIEIDLPNGQILVGGDAHYLPGEPSLGHRAFVAFAKKLKPALIVQNGDVFDGASISRFPPQNWESAPTVKEELDVCKLRLAEIVKASPKSRFMWPMGNHDQRFEAKLAAVAPEFRSIHGIHLKDQFGPTWEPCWSIFVNSNLIIKHRFRGGANAPFNNVLYSGCSMVTNHLHSAKVIPFTSLRNGGETVYGCDPGCLSDPYGPQFSYNEDSPRNHRQGFALLTIRDGTLLMPELILAFDQNRVQFRGELIAV